MIRHHVSQLVKQLKAGSRWYFIGIPVVVAILLTEAAIALLSILLKGQLATDYLLLGLGISAAVATMTSYILFQLVRRLRETETLLLEKSAVLDDLLFSRKTAEESVAQLVNYDVLTKLPNRALFRDRLERAITRSQRAENMVALMLLNLDRFKIVNDTLGHVAGDQLLLAVAERLQECVLEDDTVARLGGDEFAIVLEGVDDAEDAASVAHKILDVFAIPFFLAGHETFVTPSFGISVFPLNGDGPDSLLKNANAAMYRAKERGRNNYQFYMLEMNARSLDHLRMETGLRHALERNEFLMYYQPKVDLHSGAIVGMEALLRWNHPERGIVSPLEFIPLLEETGLITPVGEWLMRAACLQNKAWCDLGFPPLHMAVNLSARQFQGNNLAQNVATVLAETGLDPELLELEVTESMLMDDPESTVDILHQIKAMGVLRINLDDFGTGYSSLSYLKRFPVSAVKLDRSFVSGLPDDEEDVAIAVAVIAMAHSLKLKVIAEGVETTRQLDFLRQHQCDEIQGFICSEPVSAEEFLLLLQQNQGKGWLPEATKIAPIRLGRRLYKDSGHTT